MIQFPVSVAVPPFADMVAWAPTLADREPVTVLLALNNMVPAKTVIDVVAASVFPPMVFWGT